MEKRAGTTGTALFCVAPADVAVLLEDLDPSEPSVLYAQIFKQLSAAVEIYPTMPLRIADHHAETFRNWLDRAKARHAKNGDSERAQAFARVRSSEV